MAEDGVDSDQHQPAAAEGRAGETVKLFVGQLPKQMTEAELAAMFSGVALVDEVTVIRDRGTRVSRGPDPYAFIPPSFSLRTHFARRPSSLVRLGNAMRCLPAPARRGGGLASLGSGLGGG
jgi:hypothetical protein